MPRKSKRSPWKVAQDALSTSTQIVILLTALVGFAKAMGWW
jgi:hypothetical protein